jgi:hypothetical protein
MPRGEKQVQVKLLKKISKAGADVSLPQWFKIERLTHWEGNPARPLYTMSVAHESTYYKIKYADYHLEVLRQIYEVKNRRSDSEQWAKLQMHSIVFNIYSALDSLASEINLAYGFKLKPHNIQFDHNHNPKQGQKRSCVPCRMKIGKNSQELASYIDKTLRRSWFIRFKKLRHQITHRHLPYTMIGIGGYTIIIKIPNNPATTRTNPSYSHSHDLRQFCLTTREEVVKVIEHVYELMANRVERRYRFQRQRVDDDSHNM